jgi:3-hydroxyacyl-CoA dehydrogenase
MNVDEALADVALIGAAGKMGRGIALLLAQLIAETGGDRRHLHLIDTRTDGLDDLQRYLTRFGAEALLAKVDMSTDFAAAAGSRLIFEAVPEVEAIKIETLTRLRQIAAADAIFFTNTSSLPIAALEIAAGLEGRLIGFHFYNPPPVQELLELIPSAASSPDLIDFARTIGQRLGKRVVPSKDVAGFIGNGHFVREGLHAVAEARRLAGSPSPGSWAAAVWGINRVTEEALLRPMGIFQVIDYAGIDIVAAILTVMQRYIGGEGDFDTALFDRLLEAGLSGGQAPDGSQRQGFFQYDGRRIAAVYDIEAANYVDVADIERQLDGVLSPLARPGESWKELRTNTDAAAIIGGHFAWLGGLDHQGATIAKSFAIASMEIAAQLVADGIAASAADVDTVITKGFAHLYGPLDACVRPLISPTKKGKE